MSDNDQSPSGRAPIASKRTKVILLTIGILAALAIGFVWWSSMYTDYLWYQQLGHTAVLVRRWIGVFSMFAIGFLGTAVPIWGAITLAYRYRPTYVRLTAQVGRYQEAFDPLRRLVTWGLPVVFGIFGGVLSGSRWTQVLLWLNRSSFGQTDPQFHLDYGFYMFTLPLFRSALAFASGVVIIAGIAGVIFAYLYGSIRIGEREFAIAKAARVQLAITAAIYLLLQAVSLWCDRYGTLTSQSKLFMGPGYTTANASLPSLAVLAIMAALVAVLCLIAAFIGRWRLPIVGIAVFVASSLVIGIGYPWMVQKFQVDPNEKTKEQAYIARNISATREAFGLDKVKESPYQAKTDTQQGALREDAQTTAQIRILDPNVVSSAFSQLQVIKPAYYQFKGTLNVDRYKIGSQTQDTVVAVRELRSEGFSSSWYNSTFVYTHGYGMVAAYGNQRTSDGQPKFLESGIPSQGALSPYKPQIYFGLDSPEYSIVGSSKSAKPVEFDYPDATDDNAKTYTTFEGSGGPKINSWLRQIMYTLKFGSEQILFSNNVNSQSQILYDRNPLDRVKKVAPYLTVDKEAYPAVVDGRVKWIIDGYTTSKDYPYADPDSSGTFASGTNYVRNSVKATVDAYDGSVKLYAWDTKDPVLKAWSKVYGEKLLPVSSMSADLLAHVRYPTDLFSAQRSLYGRYHVTDPGTFYSKSDFWATPKNPQNQAGDNSLQPPYYLTMRLPGQQKAAFTLYTTYIPQSLTGETQRNILSGFLAVNADAGTGRKGQVSPDYGKLSLLTLSDNSNVPAPGQVQNQFKSNSEVSNALNLWNQGGSKVTLGNLLTLPMGGGMLYVQPVYVESQSDDSFPLLRRVLVAFGDKVAFKDTLDSALNDIFGGSSGASAGDNGQAAGSSDGGPETGNGSGSGTGGDAGSNSTGKTDQSALRKALQSAQSAMSDRDAARERGDWAAYGKADARLQQAIEDALTAEGK